MPVMEFEGNKSWGTTHHFTPFALDKSVRDFLIDWKNL